MASTLVYVHRVLAVGFVCGALATNVGDGCGSPGAGDGQPTAAPGGEEGQAYLELSRDKSNWGKCELSEFEKDLLVREMTRAILDVDEDAEDDVAVETRKRKA